MTDCEYVSQPSSPRSTQAVSARVLSLGLAPTFMPAPRYRRRRRNFRLWLCAAIMGSPPVRCQAAAADSCGAGRVRVGSMPSSHTEGYRSFLSSSCRSDRGTARYGTAQPPPKSKSAAPFSPTHTRYCRRTCDPDFYGKAWCPVVMPACPPLPHRLPHVGTMVDG